MRIYCPYSVVDVTAMPFDRRRGNDAGLEIGGGGLELARRAADKARTMQHFVIQRLLTVTSSRRRCHSMTSLTTPGDIAGLVLLAAAIVAVVTRATANRIAASRPGQALPAHHGQQLLAQRAPTQLLPPERASGQLVPAQLVPAQLVPAQRVAPRPPALAIPAQPTWQSRAGHAPRIQNLAGTRPDC